ncbi:hypothetical protein BDB01DRAFT_898173 [Pilobolus umbonatus]|nr:hypothetical protein BDB01DRAFT_898173 [Pilobolus umbonatus]
MKIQSIIIGEYQIAPSISFCLYQLTAPIITPPPHDDHTYQKLDYFCLDDLFSIFDLHSSNHDILCSFQSYPSLYCKDNNGRCYIQLDIMADIAMRNNCYSLADLCRLSDQDILSGSAIPLLKPTTIIRLFNKPKHIITELQMRPLDGNEWFFKNSTKYEERSPPTIPLFMSPSQSVSPKRSCLSSTPSFTLTSFPSTMMTATLEDNPMKMPKPSSLLLKRLAPKHGQKRNLTIMTPSYNEEATVSIQSAPLHKTMPKLKANKIIKKTKNSRLNVPATASGLTWPQTSAHTRFPSPPIVPSQQPAWKQPAVRSIKTATVPYFPRTPFHTTHNTNAGTSIKRDSTSPNKQLTQKQKFMQPFEYLYDNIEQTRSLKTTLDDQIRRSATLIQTLQSSNVMIESVVRRQIRESVDGQWENKLRECSERIHQLESRLSSGKVPISPVHSPTHPLTKDTTEINILQQLINRLNQLETKLEKPY